MSSGNELKENSLTQWLCCCPFIGCSRFERPHRTALTSSLWGSPRIVSVFSNNLDRSTGNHTVKKTLNLICTGYVDVNIQDFCKIKLVLMEKF